MLTFPISFQVATESGLGCNEFKCLLPITFAWIALHQFSQRILTEVWWASGSRFVSQWCIDRIKFLKPVFESVNLAIALLIFCSIFIILKQPQGCELNYQKIRRTPTYGNPGELFRHYYVSSAVCTVITTTGDRTTDHRLQCRNSTTEPSVHIAHKWRQIN